MSPDTQTLRTPKGKISEARKRRVDEVQKLDLVQLKKAGFFEHPLETPWKTSPGPNTEATVGFALLHLGPKLGRDIGIVGIYTRRDGSTTDWDLDYPILLTPTPCRLGGQRWWWRCPNYDKNPRCRKMRRRILYRPTPADKFACIDCHRLTYSSRQHHRSLEVAYTRPLRALIARNEGRDYHQLPHEDKREIHELAQRRAKFGEPRKGFL